jgi:hypothetical protein
MPDTKEEQPKDPELQKLQKELDKETLLAEIALQKKKALTESLPPTSTITPLEGKTEVDEKVLIEAEILAYRMLDAAATTIATAVAPKAGAAIVIHNGADLAAVGAYRAFSGQMEALAKEYDAIAAPSQPDALAIAGAAIVGITAAVKTVIDLVALFRTDRKIQGVQVEIMDLALVSEVAGKLAANKKKVYISELYPLEIQTEHGATVQGDLDRVRQAAIAAKLRVDALVAGADKEKATARLNALDTIRAAFDDILTRVAAEGSGPVLATLIRGAAVETFLKKGNVLYLKVLKAGGTNETKKNIFGSSKEVQHSGGVIVNYVLFDDDGSVLLSSTVNAYSGEMKDVPKG